MSAAMATFAQPEPEREHPVIAWLAVAAIVLASLLIAWARVEVHGTGDLEAALYEEPEANAPSQGDAAAQGARAVDDAVAASRWASTF
jgi:hypothetical protein